LKTLIRILAGIILVSIHTFYDREDELRILNEIVNSGHAELVILYGRRRVGKTALIRKFLENKRGFYINVEGASVMRFLSRYSS